ncbi:hypothetical protein PENTCL1PPCAC_21076, partial [Pristionchus entomophagus]
FSMDDYTLLLSAQTALIVVAFLIFLFTLRVMASFTAVHGNCKFFLMFTAVGQFLLIFSHFWKVVFWFSIDNYDQSVMYASIYFKIAQFMHEFGSFLADCNNFCMIVERIFACRNLRK